MRQSRPALVLAAAALALPLSPLADLAKRSGVTATRPDIAQTRIDDALARDFPGFLAYALLNVGFMLACFALFQRIGDVEAPNPPLGVIFIAVAMLLAACDLMKPYFWSPHNQLSNILAPVLAVWASLRAAEGALADPRFAVRPTCTSC